MQFRPTEWMELVRKMVCEFANRIGQEFGKDLYHHQRTA